ncbi:MAG: hypothetical protein JEZ08_10715 [Clostridiales bacterium]|nr:hypothetical protein [Clostridiales bacterium]
MNCKNILEYSLKVMKEAGAEKAQSELIVSEKQELNTESNKVKLFRSNENVTLKLRFIKDNRQGSLTLNKVSEDAIDEGVNELVKITAASPQDDAYDIAIKSDETFEIGVTEPDLDKVFDNLNHFTQDMKAKFSKISGDAILSYDNHKRYIMNTNDLYLIENLGYYDFNMLFAAKDGDKITSFNYTGAAMTDLNRELIKVGMMDGLLEQTILELDAKSIGEKFVGEVIITPHCLTDLLHVYSGIALQDRCMITDVSVLKDKVGEQVASPMFTWHANPRSVDVGQALTSDGFVAEDMPIIEKGILKNLMLTQYGAKKTGRERSKNHSDRYVVQPGKVTLDSMIKDVKKGILLCRFSGGQPSFDGNFSGVAKNSFYIENGEIRFPISETMVSGNLFNIFEEIKNISSETIDFGLSVLPWIHTDKTTISSK